MNTSTINSLLYDRTFLEIKSFPEKDPSRFYKNFLELLPEKIIPEEIIKINSYNPIRLEKLEKLNFSMTKYGKDPVAAVADLLFDDLEVLTKASTLKQSPRKVHDLSEWEFRTLFDSKLPTFAIFEPSGLCGSALIACAAQILRQQGQPSLNVVILTEVDDSHRSIFTNDKPYKFSSSGLLAKRGYIIDKDGNVYYGQFPYPVKVDLVDGSGVDDSFKFKCGAYAPLLNTEDVEKKARDKELNKQFCAEFGFRTSPYVCFTIKDFQDENVVRQKVSDFILTEGNQGVVVKATNECQGNGVILLDEANPDKVFNYARATAGNYGKVIIESRVRSYPYYSPSGERLDWNYRVLATPNGVIDMEARVGKWGHEPVNKHTGAKIQEAKHVHKNLGKDHEGIDGVTERRWLQELEDYSVGIAKAMGAGFLGLDLIRDEKGLLWVIEINGERSGGIVSLAEIRDSLEDKLQAPSRFASLLASRLGSERQNSIIDEISKMRLLYSKFA